MTICSSPIFCIRLFLHKYGKPSRLSPNVYLAIVNCVLQTGTLLWPQILYLFFPEALLQIQ